MSRRLWESSARWCALGLALLCQAGAAQVTTARLDGVVRDAAGAVIPGARVVATNLGTNNAYEAVTNEDGIYVFVKLPPGDYSLAAEQRGFKRSVQPRVPLLVGDTATLNLTLEPGEITQEVTVTDTPPVVDQVSQAIGSVVKEEQIQDLPLNGRQALSLFYLQAGANPRDRMTPSSPSHQQDKGSVDGLRVSANNITVEGISATDPLVDMSAAWSSFPVPLEAVGEYRVVTSNASAEYGRGAGAQVQVVYKSGTNSFHGSAFEFHRNDVLNANNFFNNRQGSRRPTFLRHQYGGALGGAIVKNKTFFFGTYEGWREKQAEIVNYPVYTQAVRNGTFRYYTKGRNVTSLVDAQGNPVVPAGDIGTINLLTVDARRQGFDQSGVVRRVLDQVPLPNNYDIGDGFNIGGYRFNSTKPFLVDQYLLKFDHQLHQNHQLGFSFGWLYSRESGPQLTSGFRAFQQDERHRGGVLSLVSTIRPNLLNDFRAGATRRDPIKFPTHPDTFNRAGRFQLTGLGAGNPQNISLPQQPVSAVITIADNLTWVKGNHTFKGGTDIRINRSNADFGGDYYIPVITTDNSANPANVPNLAGLNSNDRVRAQQLVNDLTGTIGSIRQDFFSNQPGTFTPFEGSFRRWRSREYSFFFQDTWKVRPNLTLNLGVRYDLFPPPFEANGVYAAPVGGVEGLLGISGPLGPTRLALAECGGCNLYRTDRNNFGPNVGFTWDPTKSGKWSIGAGYRMTYDRVGLVYHLLQDSLAEGSTASRTIFPGGRFTDVSRLVPLPTPTPFAPVGNRRQGFVLAYDPEMRTPYTQSWSLRVQRELFRSTVVQVAYVGNKGTKLYRAIDYNQLRLHDNGFLRDFQAAQRNLAASGNPNTGEDTGNIRRIFAPLGGIPASFNSFIAQGQAATFAHLIDGVLDPSSNLLQAAGLPLNFFRANPQFLSAFVLGNNSNSTFHGMKLEVAKRFGNDLQFQVNYTLGKALTDYDGKRFQTDPYRDKNNLGLDKTYAAFDATHVVNANFIWQLPVGRGRRWLGDGGAIVNGLLGGWQLNGIVGYSSGLPFTIDSGRNNLTLLDTSTADFCCDFSITQKIIKGNQIRVLTEQEVAQFRNPAPGSAGQLAQLRFRGPGFFVTDASVFKSFPFQVFGQEHQLQFRFEAFNVFNNVNFGRPTGNINSPNFGVITTAGDARVMQVALKYIF
jgi:hypothetical protein